MDMTVHTLRYTHKRRGFCKADIKAVPEQPVPEKTPVAVVQQKPKITEDDANDYIKQNPDTVPNYLRNCLLYTSPSPRDVEESRMPSSA